MSTDNWFARKLAGGAAPPQAPPSYQPSYPQGPAAPQHVPPVPQSTQPQVAPDGSNVAEVAGLWKGGQATKTETTSCPNCGGDHYFSMSNGASQGGAGARIATERGMAATSPRCFSCGYSTARPLQTGSM